MMVRENPYGGSRECVVGRFWTTFLRVPKRALGFALERTAACSALRGKAGLKARENMVVYVQQVKVL